MLSQKERALLLKTYEKTHNVKLAAEIFGVSARTIYRRINDFKKRETRPNR